MCAGEDLVTNSHFALAMWDSRPHLVCLRHDSGLQDHHASKAVCSLPAHRCLTLFALCAGEDLVTLMDILFRYAYSISHSFDPHSGARTIVRLRAPSVQVPHASVKTSCRFFSEPALCFYVRRRGLEHYMFSTHFWIFCSSYQTP
jgi:hypothetical protein